MINILWNILKCFLEICYDFQIFQENECAFTGTALVPLLPHP